MKTSIFSDLSEIRNRQAEIACAEGRGCERCGTVLNVARRHRNTAYDYPAISQDTSAKAGDANDPNFVSLCPPCWEEDDEYWQGLWDEYYGSRL